MVADPIRAELAQIRHVVYSVLAALIAVSVGMSVLALHVLRQQDVANQRAERQRAAICAILQNIPGHIPPEIAHARTVFARPGHPTDCQPVVHPTVRAAPSPTRAPQPTPRVTVVLIPPTSSQRPSPSPTVSRRPTARPTPSRSPTAKPSPSPTPSRTCLPVGLICV